jgi:Acetyltransferase (GNAT) domain
VNVGRTIPTLEESRARLSRFRNLTTETGIGALAICRRAEGDTIGYCALIVGRASLDEPEVAFELLQRFHGHGYATEAVQALVVAAAATGRRRLWSTARLPRSVGVEQLEYRSHRLERGQRPWPEQDLDLCEAPGAERPESVGDLLG